MAQDKFEEFAKQTSDAWDDGDDDLLLEAYNVRISKRDVQSAATQVTTVCVHAFFGLDSQILFSTECLMGLNNKIDVCRSDALLI